MSLFYKIEISLYWLFHSTLVELGIKDLLDELIIAIIVIHRNVTMEFLRKYMMSILIYLWEAYQWLYYLNFILQIINSNHLFID